MKTFTLCSILAILVSACGGVRLAAQPELPSAAGGDTIRAVDWPTLGSGAARFIRIDLGPDTFAECRKISPKFPFDSASTYAPDRAHLAAFASCLNAPTMRDRKLLLVGRADAQGPGPYDRELGMKRANAIKQLLIENGLAESRVEVASEGDKGAVGDRPEHAPGYDRRVDIVVIGGAHTP